MLSHFWNFSSLIDENWCNSDYCISLIMNDIGYFFIFLMGILLFSLSVNSHVLYFSVRSSVVFLLVSGVLDRVISPLFVM